MKAKRFVSGILKNSFGLVVCGPKVSALRKAIKTSAERFFMRSFNPILLIEIFRLESGVAKGA